MTIFLTPFGYSCNNRVLRRNPCMGCVLPQDELGSWSSQYVKPSRVNFKIYIEYILQTSSIIALFCFGGKWTQNTPNISSKVLGRQFTTKTILASWQLVR